MDLTGAFQNALPSVNPRIQVAKRLLVPQHYLLLQSGG
jgi:hypothetical protein